MPELPEVETVRMGLSRLLPGKQIVAVTHDWAKSFPNAEPDVSSFLIGSTIVGIRRRAKVLLLDLNTAYTLIVHLKMTGQLVYVATNERFGAGHPSNSLVGNLPDKTTRVTIDLSGSARLFFNDQRKFGWMRLLPTAEVQNLDFFRSVGPEPLAADFTAEVFARRLARRSASGIKAVLLDQKIIAGIGNIYADESLWGAGIHPETKVRNISSNKLNALYAELREVMNTSIACGGSTDRTFVNAEGKKGSYLAFASVFRREGRACPRCGAIVAKIRVAGRGTHICPTCQVVSATSSQR